ncbi:hypothetical protein ABEB36_014949 [Hypothenemus hampei]|uniref:Transposable element P transposase n=1 Tax=Hypothenemus hampei TaxID=57062 RepID=A0ABD1E1D5_HYPHA
MFDEMKIRKEYLYDQSKDYLMQPYDYVQVAMISGVFKAWKQPIFYDFDCKMTTSIVLEIVKFVENSGFHVVAMVSDLGGANRGLHSDLQISQSKPYFQNPSSAEKIFVMADVPHLLKLIRNNFVDHGFVIDGKMIKKEIVEEALNAAKVSDLKITHKMTIEKLNCSGPQRQKVKLAAKLFSHTLSCAISRCGTLGFLSQENWIECADFFKLVNDWFDIFNVSTPFSDSRARNRAFGLALDVQIPILTKMTQVISQMQVIGSRSPLPFQKGILISNSALKMLHVELKRRFGVDYILTRRLNQDVLENFFGVIRAKGGLHDHPNPLEFKYRLRSYVLGKNEGAYSDFSNVEVDDTPDIPLSGSLTIKLKPSFNPPSFNLDENLEELNELEYDGLENLAGFICHKLKYSCLQSSSTESSSWINHLDEGGLSKPSSTFMNTIVELNKVFIEMNGNDGIATGPNFMETLLLRSESIHCPDKAKRLFLRSRTFFRIKELNRSMKEKKARRNG